ncbi:methylisocitrate lyase ICL2 KNAG_0D02360 [Huiozyma naganishii CBS 8797]|uniref:Isocitrate lyase n=1 Tax=Huiozyma naganishii (strain ATCC MYA-139 / BCRC 22969 / CBS 8797 / KCTC 17520 / NBRC 10181 / NCYC 3082 / Yp74L-3) TaxID=1071383 RepID=J7S6Y1_HUIN7|nr:hypothetical protein KNAG_0D02360 [Kazachstania naganishii CBS 8797]CCK69986.1 hypothetical protein KNAG_0D02360 [Kazachstania naganishii CBS 8797]
MVKQLLARRAYRVRPRYFSQESNPGRRIARDVKEVEQWWKSDRFQDVKRPYTALDVVKHRGSLPTDVTKYPSSFQATKLHSLINEKFAAKQPLHTLGVIDPVQMSQLARCKDIQVSYVSGWACSSTMVGSTNEVSPDFGDYPYDTVPNQVERIFKAQQLHDRKAVLESIETGGELVDYMKPIIADADMGHGGPTTVMKLAKLFAEKGAAAIHLEDQLVGGKRCGHLSGATLVPTSTHLSRLIATRLQWDIMGTENLIIARTDSCNSKLISSNIDQRDHSFIQGIVNGESLPWADLLSDMEGQGASKDTIASAELEWYESNPLYTFNEALQLQMTQEEYKRYVDMMDRVKMGKQKTFLSISEQEAIAKQVAPTKRINFNWDKPRSKEGYYMFKGCMEAALQRSLAFAPYADMLWLETKTPDLEQARFFSNHLHGEIPEAKLVYNLSPSFNWMAHGFTNETLQSFIWDLAREGFVLQLVSLAGLHVDGVSFWELASKFQTQGMRAYTEVVQQREKTLHCDLLTHQRWSGAEYIDSLMKVVQNGSSSQTLSTSGDSFTEKQF